MEENLHTEKTTVHAIKKGKQQYLCKFMMVTKSKVQFYDVCPLSHKIYFCDTF